MREKMMPDVLPSVLGYGVEVHKRQLLGIRDELLERNNCSGWIASFLAMTGQGQKNPPKFRKTHGGFWRHFNLKHLRNNTTPWGEGTMPRCCREVVHRFLIWIFLRIANLIEKNYQEHGGHIVLRVQSWCDETNSSSFLRITLVTQLELSYSHRRSGMGISFLSRVSRELGGYLPYLYGSSSIGLRLRFCPILGVRRTLSFCELSEFRRSSCSDISSQDVWYESLLFRSYLGDRDSQGWLYVTLRCSWILLAACAWLLIVYLRRAW